MSRAWSPNDIASKLEFRYTISDPASIITDNGKISQWKDKSSKGRHAYNNDAGSRPVYPGQAINGYQSVDSTSQNTKLRVDNPAGGLRTSIPIDGTVTIAVFNTGTGDNSTRFLTGGYSGSRYDLFLNGTSNQFGYNVNNGDFNMGPALGSAASWHVVALWVKGGKAYPIIDGRNYATSTPGTANIGGIDLGAYAGGAPTWHGAVAEVIFASAATRDTVDRLVGWAHWFYGLQGLLPDYHKYKKAAPTVDLINNAPATRLWTPVDDLASSTVAIFDALEATSLTFTPAGDQVLSISSLLGSTILSRGSSGSPRYKTTNGTYALYGSTDYAFFSTSAVSELPTGAAPTTMVLVGKGAGAYAGSFTLDAKRQIGTVGPQEIGLPSGGSDLGGGKTYGANGNIVIAQFDAGSAPNVKLFSDGALLSSANRSGIDTASMTQLTLLLNSNSTTAGDFFQAALVIRGILSTENRQKIEGWAAWRYNLVAQLPADHPHKSAAPIVTITRSWTPLDLKQPPIGLWTPADVFASGGVITAVPNHGSMGSALDLIPADQGNPTLNPNGFGTGFPSLDYDGRQPLRAKGISLTGKTYIIYTTARVADPSKVTYFVGLGNDSEYATNSAQRAMMLKMSKDTPGTLTAERGSVYYSTEPGNGPMIDANVSFLAKGSQSPNSSFVDKNAVHTQAPRDDYSDNFNVSVLSYGGDTINFYSPNLVGSMGSGVLVDYIPTQEEEDRIYGWLAAQDNQKGNLPSGQPYKNAAPMYGSNDNAAPAPGIAVRRRRTLILLAS